MIKRNYFILLLLALLFAAPGLTAYLYYLHPQWLGATTTNKGELLTPPVLLTKVLSEKSKWRLIFWNPNNCEVACLQDLDRLARVRLALGRRLYEVEQWLVSAEGDQQMSMALTNTLQGQDIHVLRLSKNDRADLPVLKDEPEIFIANPDGYLVLAYPASAKPEDIYHDIKQLLNTTEKKSG